MVGYGRKENKERKHIRKWCLVGKVGGGGEGRENPVEPRISFSLQMRDKGGVGNGSQKTSLLSGLAQDF